MSLCPYKNVFGAPGEGAHSLRVFDIAIVDVVATILVALVVSYISNIGFPYILISLFILGILLHRFFCVRTTIDKLLFP